MTQPTSETLSQAADLLRAKKIDEARSLLTGFLRENPDSDAGWWLMSYAVSDPDQQVSCLKRVLLHYPNHSKARARLAVLTGETDDADAAVNQPASTASTKQKKKSLSLPAIALLVVFGCVGFAVIGYFGYQIFFPPQIEQPAQAVVVQNLVQTSTPVSKSILPPTWTSTPTSPPPATRTPLPRTEIPVSTNTPTPDPNATSTPIPENKIGTGNGQYPPDFTLVDALSGQEISLSDYADQPVMVIFLTTWCPSCEREMPGVQAMYEKYQDQGFVVIGVGIGASRAALRTYANRFGLTFPLLSDWTHDVADEYEVNYIPTNYMVRKSGKIWQVSVGMMKEDELDAVITSILKVP